MADTSSKSEPLHVDLAAFLALFNKVMDGASGDPASLAHGRKLAEVLMFELHEARGLILAVGHQESEKGEAPTGDVAVWVGRYMAARNANAELAKEIIENALKNGTVDRLCQSKT